MPLGEAELDALKAKHGRQLQLITTPEGEVVVRAPDRATWRMFKSMVSDDSKRELAAERLLHACLVHPDKVTLERMLDDAPALEDVLAGAVLELAKQRASIEKKAL